MTVRRSTIAGTVALVALIAVVAGCDSSKRAEPRHDTVPPPQTAERQSTTPAIAVRPDTACSSVPEGIRLTAYGLLIDAFENADHAGTVRLCASGRMLISIDTLQPPATEGEGAPLRQVNLSGKRCVLYLSYSGGASCCFSASVFCADSPYYRGTVPTYSSTTEVKDVNGDGINELVVRDYAHFPVTSAGPLPPRAIYIVSDNAMIMDTSARFRDFYRAEATSYDDDLKALRSGKCDDYGRKAFMMYVASVNRSGDSGAIAAAAELRREKASCLMMMRAN